MFRHEFDPNLVAEAGAIRIIIGCLETIGVEKEELLEPLGIDGLWVVRLSGRKLGEFYRQVQRPGGPPYVRNGPEMRELMREMVDYHSLIILKLPHKLIVLGWTTTSGMDDAWADLSRLELSAKQFAYDTQPSPTLTPAA